MRKVAEVFAKAAAILPTDSNVLRESILDRMETAYGAINRHQGSDFWILADLFAAELAANNAAVAAERETLKKFFMRLEQGYFSYAPCSVSGLTAVCLKLPCIDDIRFFLDSDKQKNGSDNGYILKQIICIVKFNAAYMEEDDSQAEPEFLASASYRSLADTLYRYMDAGTLTSSDSAIEDAPIAIEACPPEGLHGLSDRVYHFYKAIEYELLIDRVSVVLEPEEQMPYDISARVIERFQTVYEERYKNRIGKSINYQDFVAAVCEIGGVKRVSFSYAGWNKVLVSGGTDQTTPRNYVCASVSFGSLELQIAGSQLSL